MDEQSGVDFALVALFGFIGFFVMLVLYLRREDRREGYPLEEDVSGVIRAAGGVLTAARPKTFRMPFGGADVVAPNGLRDSRAIAAERVSVTPGSPYQPTGNPMLDGVGPGSYAERAKVPAVTFHGDLKIVPMRTLPDFSISARDADPRGMVVLGCDGVTAGTVTDVWVDRAEVMIRYLELTLAAAADQHVLLPQTMARIDKRRRMVLVSAITGGQFADVPRLEHPEQVTFYEEERITAYYGGGFLYATPGRSEPRV